MKITSPSRLRILALSLSIALCGLTAFSCHRKEEKSAGPIVVGNGGGEAEYFLVYVQSHLPELLSVCRKPICNLSPVAESELESLRGAAQTPLKAVFVRETVLEAKVFELRQEAKQIREVWFNQDALWMDQERSKPYDISAALKLWIHVLGESLPTRLRAESEIVEALSPLISANIRSVLTVPISNQTFEATLWRRETQNDRLFLRDPSDFTVDVSGQIEKVLSCSERVTNLKLYSARWSTVQREVPALLSLRLALRATWLCSGEASRGRIEVVATANDPASDPVSDSSDKDSRSAIDARSINLFLGGD